MNRDEIMSHPLYLPFAKALMKGRALPKVEAEFGDMLCPDDPLHDPDFRERRWVGDTVAQIGLFIETVAGPNDTHTMPWSDDMGYIGWGGRFKRGSRGWNLGWSLDSNRGTTPHGIRRVIWDAAYGYVNGFPKRDILYYVLTRSISKRLWTRVEKWESKRRAA